MLRQEHLTVKSELSVLNSIQSWFRQFCQRSLPNDSWLEHYIYPLNLALAEGFTNAVRHAHQKLPRETEIEINLVLCDDNIEIHIWDYGQPFNPMSIDEPQPGTLRLGGYGWYLLRRLADQVTYERSQDNSRNCLIIKKHRAH